MFGFVTVNWTSMIAALSVTSIIEISSNWISMGRTSRGVSEGEIRLPPDTSSMIVEPENPTIPIIIANTATIPPAIILEFNKIITSVTILNVKTKNAYSEFLLNQSLQYFQAVKIGKERANKSQMTLFNLCGFGMITLTIKKVDGKFLPVGEEEFVAVIHTKDGYVTIIVDEDGYTKAQSKPLEKVDAMDIYKKAIDSGISEYAGKQVEIWTESYTTVQNE